jgi:hypothetical protein
MGLPDEDQEQSPFVVVISHHLWWAMGELLQIVGGSLRIGRSTIEIVFFGRADYGVFAALK